ncbi:MAG: hypothetical protein J6U40_12330, partial [Kiritimatiellae bacterium]|nr:hypothetical protein [Kiritimatiellia bacterium]
AVYAKLLAEGAMEGATSYWETVGSPSPVAEAIQTPTTVAVTNSEASSAGAVSFRARILASPDVSAMRDFQVYETGSVTNEISLEASEVLVNLFYPCTEKRYTGKHFLYLAQLGDASQTNQYRVTSWTPEVTNRSVTATTHRWNRSEAKAYAVFTNEFEVVSVSTETNGLNKIITFATNRYWTASLVCTSRYAAVAERVVTNQTQTVISSTNEVRYTSHGDAQYRLRSQSWKPGTVGFGSAAMKVSETAEKVSIPIKRTGGNSGVVRLRYWTEDGTATGWMAGNTPDGNVDFAHQSGILTWPDGGSATTNLVIDLIQDLRPIWEGDETFTVHLEPAEDAERFQAALTVDTLTVTLSEKTTRSPGKATVAGYQTGEDEGMVSFVNPKKPTLTAFAGSTVTLYVAREDGTDGILDATVVPTSKNRADPTVTVAYPGGAAELIWTNGVAETLPVEVTLPLLDEASREVVLTVKSATKGAVKTPASVTVTVLNQAATCASTELADAEPWGITVKDAAKAWYWDASESLVGSVAPKQTVTFQLSVTGPGVLRYGWSAEGWSAASSWLCSGGVAKRSYPGTASTDEVLVKAGKQTITWTVKNNGAAELVPTLADLRWHPLPTVDLPVPGNGAQTSSTRLDYTLFPTNTVLLGKTVTAVDSELMVDLEVTCLAPKPDEAVILSAGDAETFFDDPAAKLTPKTTVSWRVDVAYADGDGNRLVRTGAKWGFTLMDPAAEATDAPLPETVDQDETESYLAYRGIWCDLGVVTPAESGYSYKILGPLPKGMKLLDNRTGRIGGAPSATGTFAFELQAVGPDRLPRTSRTIRIRVVEATDDQIAAITAPGNWTPGTGMVAGYRLQVAVGQETEWALPEPLDGVRVAAGSLPSGLRFIAAEGAL